jgi:hypothetical protein
LTLGHAPCPGAEHPYSTTSAQHRHPHICYTPLHLFAVAAPGRRCGRHAAQGVRPSVFPRVQHSGAPPKGRGGQRGRKVFGRRPATSLFGRSPAFGGPSAPLYAKTWLKNRPKAGRFAPHAVLNFRKNLFFEKSLPKPTFVRSAFVHAVRRAAADALPDDGNDDDRDDDANDDMIDDDDVLPAGHRITGHDGAVPAGDLVSYAQLIPIPDTGNADRFVAADVDQW